MRAAPSLLYIHGRRIVLGSLELSAAAAAKLAVRTGCTIASVDYRLAPEHPRPDPGDDCYAALGWIAPNTAKLGIAAGRIGVYGASAGGGLAAAVALMARDHGGPSLAIQALICPMLDDRNASPSSHEIKDIGVWDRDANIEGWRALLGSQAGGEGVSPYAAPARAQDLVGLPPAYIGVGELLSSAMKTSTTAHVCYGPVATELYVYPGGIHGTDVYAPGSAVAWRTVGYRTDALKRWL